MNTDKLFRLKEQKEKLDFIIDTDLSEIETTVEIYVNVRGYDRLGIHNISVLQIGELLRDQRDKVNKEFESEKSKIINYIMHIV